MNTNIRVLIEVCDELGIHYEIASTTGNLVALIIENKNYLFLNWATPINNQAIYQLCLDKGYFYEFFKGCVSMPETRTILDPNCNSHYDSYIESKDTKAIVDSVTKSLTFPLIIKPNKGCGGLGVYKVTNEDEFIFAINNIFDKRTRLYDYIALAQSYIISKCEYRAIFVDGELVFAYEKNCTKAEFKGNLSPLHWEGSTASLVANKNTLNEIQSFAGKIFEKLHISYCGLDIIVDSANKYWLIEANGSPSFDYFIRDNGVDKLKEMYAKIILNLCARQA